MSNDEFYIGDRVVAIGVIDGKHLDGKYGTIIKKVSQNPSIGVQFDEYIEGHDCTGEGENGYCWFCFANKLKLIDDEEIEDAEPIELITFLQSFSTPTAS